MRDEMLRRCEGAIRECLAGGGDPDALAAVWNDVPAEAQALLAEALATAVDAHPDHAPAALTLAERVRGRHVGFWLQALLSGNDPWLDASGGAARSRAARRLAHLSRAHADLSAIAALRDAGLGWEVDWYDGRAPWRVASENAKTLWRGGPVAKTLVSEFTDRVENPIGRDPMSASEWLVGEWWAADAEARAAWARALAELGENGSSRVRAEVLNALRQISDPAIDALVLEWLAASPRWLDDPHPTRGPEKRLGVGLVEAAFGDVMRNHPEARPVIAQRARDYGLQDLWLLQCVRVDRDGEGRAAFAARVGTGRALGRLAESLGAAFSATPNYMEAVRIAAACSREDRVAFLAGMGPGFPDAASVDAIREALGLDA